MKKTILSVFSLLAIATILTSNSNGRTDGRSGSPGDGQDCGQCHGASSTSTSSMIATDIPNSGYIGGSTYNVTVTVAEVGKASFGFQITAEHGDNSKAGTFATGGNTKVHLGNGGALVTQNSTGTTGTDSKSWTMTWTAPTAGSGDVTFYAAGNAANGNGSSSGDAVYTDSQAVTDALSTGVEIVNIEGDLLSIYPNPTTEYFSIKGITNTTLVTIYDIRGVLVKSFMNHNAPYSVSELNTGTYFVLVDLGLESKVEKLIIQ